MLSIVELGVVSKGGHDETTAIAAKDSHERCMTLSNRREILLEQKVLHATNAFISYLFPFTSAVPVSLSRDIDTPSSSRSISSSHSRKLYSQYHEAAVDAILLAPPGPPRRKGSWISRSHGTERRQSCRRVNYRRDWSGELEESDYRLPFPLGVEETERGRRTVSFRDEIVLPRIDTSVAGQGLMIDMEQMGTSTVEEEGEREDVEGSAVGTESSLSSPIESLETDMSTSDSEWTAFSEEAEGIEMLF